MQGGQWQTCRQRLLQRPAHDLPGEPIKDDRQVDELGAQANIGDIRHPELIKASQRQPARKIEIDLKLMLRIRGRHKRPRLDRQQIVFAHETRHAFVVHQ